jgi:hypothetical protein
MLARHTVIMAILILALVVLLRHRLAVRVDMSLMQLLIFAKKQRAMQKDMSVHQVT